jgi:hypothetical protein
MDPSLPPKKKINTYLKYSGLGFQFAALIVFSIFCGKWIDAKLGMTKPIFTMLLVLIFFSGFMYKLYVELIKNK